MSIFLGAVKSKKDYITKIYGNLTEREGIITTKSDWYDKNGIKRLQYGFDPYRDSGSKILSFYSWDHDDSGMGYYEFEEKLKDFFEKKYKKQVNDTQALYVGWKRLEEGWY
jgi:hypothetical protein